MDTGEVHKLVINRGNSFTTVSGKAASGKTTFLMGTAYRLASFGKKVIWLDVTGEINSLDLPENITCVECYHLNQLKSILSQSQQADAIILDDLHQIMVPEDKLSYEVWMLFIKDIPEGQERFYSMKVTRNLCERCG